MFQLIYLFKSIAILRSNDSAYNAIVLGFLRINYVRNYLFQIQLNIGIHLVLRQEEKIR